MKTWSGVHLKSSHHLQVQWRPVPATVYHSFPIPILTTEDKAKAGLMVLKKNIGDENAIINFPVGAVSKNGTYVPPHLRKGGLGLLLFEDRAKMLLFADA